MTLPDRTLVLRAEIVDLSEDLADTEHRHRRHLLWALLGFSPTAVIPAIGIALGQATIPLGVLIMLLVGREAWKTVTTGRDARRLRSQIADREDELDSGLVEG